MSDTIQVTKSKRTNEKTKSIKAESIPINNILQNKIEELTNTVKRFEKLQENYKIRLTPIIHNTDDLIEYGIDRKSEQLSPISNDITQINAVLSGIYSVMNNLLDNLEI